MHVIVIASDTGGLALDHIVELDSCFDQMVEPFRVDRRVDRTGGSFPI